MDYLGWLLLGMIIGGGASYLLSIKVRMVGYASSLGHSESSVTALLHAHFQPAPISSIAISERKFPFHMRADLQRTIDELFGRDFKVHQFHGVRKEYAVGALSISDCTIETENNPVVSIPPEYEELDIGESQPFRVLKNGLWLLESNGFRFAVMLSPCGSYGEVPGMQIQVGTSNTVEGTEIVQQFFNKLEAAISKAASYRGKILSLEKAEHSYSGESTGITVHKLRNVEREQVILPEVTLALLERNVINFVLNRSRLADLGMSTKKGLLFYGPPGTGKTHTIHYLARALKGHTTLLISAEQVGLLGQYMTLARLLQPSIVVMEDVDLIARDRKDMGSPCEEVLLNKLLNEMDGLKEAADILFILTTNRPESLEAALASRPGRVDQAIEFPLPDEAGRRKLVSLYAPSVKLDDAINAEIVRRTDGVSAAFIKELMRRAAQFGIERNDDGQIEHQDVDNAIDEMLYKGGPLNLSILGATGRVETESQS